MISTYVRVFCHRDGLEVDMNGSFQSKNLLVFSFVMALMGFGATLLHTPIWFMLNTDQWSQPGSAPFAILLAVVFLLVVASWLSTFVGVAKAESEPDKVSAYGWSASALAVNAMTCTLIFGLVDSVWRYLDDNADARLARVMVFIASVQLLVALIAAVRQLIVRIQPATSSEPEVSGFGPESE